MIIAKETLHSKRVSFKLLKRLQQTQHGQKKLNFLTSTCQALIEVLACMPQLVGGPSACAATPQPIPTMRWNSMLMRHEVKRGVVPTWMLRPYDWTLSISEQFIQELRERIQLIFIPGGLLQRCYAAVEFRICFAHLPIHRRYMTGGFAMESATSCHDSKYEIAKGGSETRARMATDDGHIYIYRTCSELLMFVLLFNLVQNVQNSEHVQNLGGVQNFLNRRAGTEGGMEQGGELSVRAKSSRWGAEDSSANSYKDILV